MRKFVLFALFFLNGLVAKAQLNPLQGHGLPTTPTSGCTSPYTDLDTGTFYTCAGGQYIAGGNPSLLDNVVYVDGVTYPFTAAGVQAAIAKAVSLGAGGGQSMAVHIAPNPNGIAQGTTSITMKGSVNVICDGIATAVFDFSGTGSTGAFDWPLGTNSAQLLGCKVELFGASGTPTCFTLEGSIAQPNVNNAIINTACATEQTTGTQKGIVITSGGSGVASGVSANLFRDIIFGGILGTVNPVQSNGDFNNQFLNLVYRGTNSSRATPFIGSFENDRMDISMSAEGSTGVAMLTLQGNAAGNIIHEICDLSASDTCLNESGGGNAGGNIIEISDANLTPLGTKLSSSLVHFCTLTAAITGICTDYAPAINFADSGQCTMASGTCTAQSLTHTYSVAPKCGGFWTGTGTLTGILKFPSTTSTTTPASSVGTDTAQINWFCFGPA